MPDLRVPSDADFRVLFEALPGAVVVLRPDRTVVAATARYLRTTHRRFEDLVGRDLAEAFPVNPAMDADVPENFRVSIRQVLATGEADEMPVQQFDLQRPDGSFEARYWKPVHTPVRGADGEIAWIFHAVEDVTRQVVGASREARTTSLLDAIVEHMPSMVFVKEAENLSFVRVNRACEELMGYPREALLGRTDHDLFPPEEAAFFQRKDRETLASAEVIDIPEESMQSSTGTRWLHTRKVTVRGPDGRPTHLLGISSDITERKALDEELRLSRLDLERRVEERTALLRREIEERKKTELALRRSEEQLQHSQKMEAVGRLAGGIAHDFNNLLAVVLSYAGLGMRDLPEDAPLRHHLEEIVQAGERAAALTRQLLAFSRQQVLEPRRVDLSGIVDGMERMLRRVIGEDIALSTACDGALHPIRVDPGQIEQVLMNLVVNARDAMPRGGELILETRNIVLDEEHARQHFGVAPGEYVCLAVTDTGTGMDRETQSRIFEPFFTTKGTGKGTGLGLATVFGIVRQSRGSIWVYSEPGKGTTFKIYFPKDTSGDTPVEPRVDVVDLRGQEVVLLVEDDVQVRTLARTILQKYGYRVLSAADAEEALEIAQGEPGRIDLLLSDVVMPKTSGVELARRLALTRPEIVVLCMSGYTDEAVVNHGLVGSGIRFLQKPFTVDALLRKVREALQSRR